MVYFFMFMVYLLFLGKNDTKQALNSIFSMSQKKLTDSEGQVFGGLESAGFSGGAEAEQ